MKIEIKKEIVNGKFVFCAYKDGTYIVGSTTTIRDGEEETALQECESFARTANDVPPIIVKTFEL